MVLQKDFKRLVRARMQKTGESYTSARANLLTTVGPPAPRNLGTPALRHTSTPAPPDFPALAGMSDAAVKAATGCTWDKWVHVLDKAGADEWKHAEIVKHITAKYKTGPWWRQMVAVGYERIKGLREARQQRSGEYQAGKSRTVAMPVERLYRAFATAAGRKRLLPGVSPTVRTSLPNRSLRMTWPDGTRVECFFTAKGPGKSAVQVTHVKLKAREEVDRAKAYWGEVLDRLAEGGRS